MSKKSIFLVIIFVLCLHVSVEGYAQGNQRELTQEEVEIIEMLDFLENIDVLEENIDLLESLEELNLIDEKEPEPEPENEKDYDEK